MGLGALLKKDGKYMLMNQQHPNGMMLIGSGDMMKPNIGHKMKVMGTMQKGSMMNGDLTASLTRVEG